MVVKLSISGTRESVHAALIELMAITQSTGVIVTKIDDYSGPGDINPTDTQIRKDAARTGQGRVR